MFRLNFFKRKCHNVMLMCILFILHRNYSLHNLQIAFNYRVDKIV